MSLPFAQQRAAIGLKRRHPHSRLLVMPGYDALNDLVNAIDPVSLAGALNRWLIAHSDLLPKTLALDGKDLGGKGHLGAIATLCHHATGTPLAMATYSGKKDDCEMPVAQGLLREVAGVLPHAVVSGDALHCQKNGADAHLRRGRRPARTQGQPADPPPDRG